MRHLERTVFSPTVFYLGRIRCAVAFFTKPRVESSTEEESHRAAKHAFPVDELGTVPFDADIRANTHFLH